MKSQLQHIKCQNYKLGYTSNINFSIHLSSNLNSWKHKIIK